jgi:polyketide biosynthesis acyl carrier protein
MSKDEIFGIVKLHTCEVIPELNGYEFKWVDKLVDLGANSVDRAEIISKTLESFELQIPRVELFGAKNLGELVDILYEKLQSI